MHQGINWPAGIEPATATAKTVVLRMWPAIECGVTRAMTSSCRRWNWESAVCMSCSPAQLRGFCAVILHKSFTMPLLVAILQLVMKGMLRSRWDWLTVHPHQRTWTAALFGNADPSRQNRARRYHQVRME